MRFPLELRGCDVQCSGRAGWRLCERLPMQALELCSYELRISRVCLNRDFSNPSVE